MPVRTFHRILVANRSEIAIRIFRACTELDIRTIGVYSKEDHGALHRYKADETYALPEKRDPLKAYLDIEAIVRIAREHEIDAIHPGYGFLSENADFARACEDAGIVFIGPPPAVLDAMGDKTAARRNAQQLGIPVVPGTDGPMPSAAAAAEWAAGVGYPVILKASFGGGGRGMRVAHDEPELQEFFAAAAREAEAAFGRGDIFLEKYLQRPKHIEVQVLADSEGSTLHLFERDCSVQRRHQKVIEIAPSPSISPALRENLCRDAVRLARSVNYVNAGTVEFLVDEAENYYFIEMNPRIQVEHTITELITGIDIVKCQIHIAEGLPLSDPAINLPDQNAVQMRGYAIQCRITTEDPANNFIPDYGRITHYRSAAGFGIRLDGGTAFTGAVITPFYDSLLVKVSAWSLSFQDACNKLSRALSEFRVRGVKTNIPFLGNVIRNPVFRQGRCTTTFIEESPELFHFPQRADRATKVLEFIGDVVVNGNPQVPQGSKPKKTRAPVIPTEKSFGPPPEGTRDLFRKLGPEAFAAWTRDQRRLLVTDTTLRDAHQSLLATRLRTYDMLKVADSIARDLPQLFSLEMWGGATFDVAMRFLSEDPWERLGALREKIPNILFQMLLRGSNAVGYTNYPDNVVKEFVRVAARDGIDLFRIFDSLNYVPAMLPAIDAVREAGAIAEAAICYTGDIFDPARKKYHLSYYVRLARELEAAGATMLAIKDMAGLCRPYAARKLVETLKNEVGIPIHFHTHDTAGGQVASLLFAAEAGVDVVDTAISSMSGLTSQPSMEALAAALQRQPRDTLLDFDALTRHAEYWLDVREMYAPFESDLRAGSGDVYIHEIPGGQYSNLRPQAEAMGVGDRLPELKRMYAAVNEMLGDIVKVTPSSKVVGDLALYMLTHNLTPETILERGEEIQFPESVVGFFAGEIGYPEGGFPERLQRLVLKGREPLEGRMAEMMPPIDFAATKSELEPKIQRSASDEDLLSYLLYPRVFLDFESRRRQYGDVSEVPTNIFFYGMEPEEETAIEIEEGKTLFIKLITRTEVDARGEVTLFYDLNGHPREVKIPDKAVAETVQRHPRAEPQNMHHVGAPMPGAVVEVDVKPGDEVEKEDLLVAIEAMKVQMYIYSPIKGIVKEVLVKPGDRIDTQDLLVVFQ
ncbi:MAG TPA: pyruvate carboxylase [Armatimonadota bacterium]|nr:pyruvate carboxylase [Armatimonadota bacterium]